MNDELMRPIQPLTHASKGREGVGREGVWRKEAYMERGGRKRWKERGRGRKRERKEGYMERGGREGYMERGEREDREREVEVIQNQLWQWESGKSYVTQR